MDRSGESEPGIFFFRNSVTFHWQFLRAGGRVPQISVAAQGGSKKNVSANAGETLQPEQKDKVRGVVGTTADDGRTLHLAVSGWLCQLYIGELKHCPAFVLIDDRAAKRVAVPVHSGGDVRDGNGLVMNAVSRISSGGTWLLTAGTPVAGAGSPLMRNESKTSTQTDSLKSG